MQSTFERLAEGELRVLAGTRLAVAAGLAAAAAEVDRDVAATVSGKRFLLALKVPSLPPAFVRSDGVRASAYADMDGGSAGSAGGVALAPAVGAGPARRPGGLPSLTLVFPSALACATILSGGRGTPLPLPSGRGALASLAFFKTAAPAAAALVADEAADPVARARLLATAALAGVVAVGNLDAGLAERIARMPDGAVAVEAPGAFSLGVEKRGSSLRRLSEAPASPNARLSFAGAAQAVAVFSGRRPATVALGSGEVELRGLLPLAQGLFAVLDRLGEYLAVGPAEATR